MDNPLQDQPPLQLRVAGEDSVIVRFGEHPSPELSEFIHQYQSWLKSRLGNAHIDSIPAYCTLWLQYDPRQLPYNKLHSLLAAEHPPTAVTPNNKEATTAAHQPCLELPVYYGAECGPDQQRIADRNNLTVADLIEYHSRSTYHVYAVGFAPGFAYLGETEARIQCPRLANPRARIPWGAVGIADRQTAIYPSDSPGGWNIIGRCPIPMIKANTATITPNQRVRFYPINQDEYLQLGGRLDDLPDWSTT